MLSFVGNTQMTPMFKGSKKSEKFMYVFLLCHGGRMAVFYFQLTY